MVRGRIALVGIAAVGTALAVWRHFRGAAHGLDTPGGILMGDAGAYDVMSRLLLGPFYGSIAADVARSSGPEATVLEVGCGPGHLANRLARDHGLTVTGLDLDPAMIGRATRNADRAGSGGRRPTFVVGDVAFLPFPDASFDLVVSTLSMHHWTDPIGGLTEIARVLRPGGRVLVWDLRPGGLPFHEGMPDPVSRLHGAPLRLVRAEPWHWPWRFSLSERLELAA